MTCYPYIDGSVQERRNSIAKALELHLSCTNPSISSHSADVHVPSSLQSLLNGPREQSMISSLVSWISTGNTLRSLQEGQACPEFPWFAYQVLLAETEYEAESRLWPTIQQELFDNADMPVDQALKVRGAGSWQGKLETVLKELIVYIFCYSLTLILHGLNPISRKLEVACFA